MTEKLLTFPSPTPLLPPQTLEMGSIGQIQLFPEQHQHKPTKTFVPGEHARIQEFLSGGGGVVSRLLNLFYSLQRGSNGLITHFPGGSNFSRGGGVQMLISIETHITITCEFPEGSGPSIPPLDPHMDNVAFWHEWAPFKL